MTRSVELCRGCECAKMYMGYVMCCSSFAKRSADGTYNFYDGGGKFTELDWDDLPEHCADALRRRSVPSDCVNPSIATLRAIRGL